MESNVLSWNQALEKGNEPRLYSYLAANISLGEYEAKLDFKVWPRKISGICCYYTQMDTGVKFQLTVYRRQKDELYMIEGCDIDFKTANYPAYYHIKVDLNSKGNITFKHAVASPCS